MLKFIIISKILYPPYLKCLFSYHQIKNLIDFIDYCENYFNFKRIHIKRHLNYPNYQTSSSEKASLNYEK